MNILFLLRFFPVYGGGEAVTCQLANAFSKRNHRVSILYLWNSKDMDVKITDEVELHQVFHMHPPTGIDEIEQKDFEAMKASLRKLVVQNKIDVVINQWWPPQIVFDAANGCAKIITCHHTSVIRNSPKKDLARKILSAGIYNKMLKYILQKRYRDYYNCSDAWVFLAECFKKEAAWIFDCEETDRKLQVIHNPCIYSGSQQDGPKGKKVLFVGRLMPVKNIPFLLKVWEDLQEYVIDNDWYLQIVGDGSSRQEIQAYIEQNRIRNVSMEGRQDPKAYYEKAQILCVTSDTEGWPLVIPEAMMFGCIPIVRNTFSSVNEIIHTGTDGMIVENNLEKYENALKELMEQDKKRMDMAENAKAAGSRFNIDVIADNWEQLFEEILQVHNRREWNCYERNENAASN